MTRCHLLTGSGSGIGAAVATLLHARGDELVLLARSEQRAAELRERYAGVSTVVADLAEPAGALELDLPDRLDSVVHAAGVVDLATVAETDAATWRAHLDVNLVAPALLTRAALPALRAAGGTVVFVNSTGALSVRPSWSAYAASKSGLRALADALREEEKEHGVRVSTVFPGRTATPMQEKVHGQEGKDYRAGDWAQPSTVAETIRHVLDLPRDATVSDVTVRPAG